MTIIMVMMMMIPYNSSAHGHTADFASMRRGETGWKQIMFMLWCYLDLNLHASFPASSILHALIFLSGPSALPGNSKAGVLVVGGGRGLEKSLPGELRRERWVKRQELTRAPRSAEEIALDDKEASLVLR